MADAGGRSSGKRYSLFGAHGREKGCGGKGRGWRQNKGNDDRQDEGSGGKVDERKQDISKGDSVKWK